MYPLSMSGKPRGDTKVRPRVRPSRTAFDDAWLCLPYAFSSGSTKFGSAENPSVTVESRRCISVTSQRLISASYRLFESTVKGRSNEVEVFPPWRCDIELCCGVCIFFCGCHRRSAGPTPAGHDKGLLPGWSVGLGPISRVRRRKVPGWVVLASVDENLDSRPAVLLRLRQWRRTSPGPAPTRWLWRGDSARPACPARNLTARRSGYTSLRSACAIPSSRCEGSAAQEVGDVNGVHCKPTRDTWKVGEATGPGYCAKVARAYGNPGYDRAYNKILVRSS